MSGIINIHIYIYIFAYNHTHTDLHTRNNNFNARMQEKLLFNLKKKFNHLFINMPIYYF